jgi:hypothetical protein
MNEPTHCCGVSATQGIVCIALGDDKANTHNPAASNSCLLLEFPLHPLVSLCQNFWIPTPNKFVTTMHTTYIAGL